VGTAIVSGTTKNRDPAILGSADALDAGYATSINGACSTINYECLARPLDTWSMNTKTNTKTNTLQWLEIPRDRAHAVASSANRCGVHKVPSRILSLPNQSPARLGAGREAAANDTQGNATDDIPSTSRRRDSSKLLHRRLHLSGCTWFVRLHVDQHSIHRRHCRPNRALHLAAHDVRIV
jgi:hypothetical protein